MSDRSWELGVWVDRWEAYDIALEMSNTAELVTYNTQARKQAEGHIFETVSDGMIVVCGEEELAVSAV